MAGHVGSVGVDHPTFCSECFRSLRQGGGCKRRDCPAYAPTYLRDQAERLRENLAAWEGKTCLVTLTAPGAGELPRDRSKCPTGEHRCSGRLGCRVHWCPAARWSATVTKCLGELLKLAREQTRRQHADGARVEVLAYVCESQQRGVFHPHAVLGYRTAQTGRLSIRFGRRWVARRGDTDSGRAGADRSTGGSRIGLPRVMRGVTSASTCVRTEPRPRSFPSSRRSVGSRRVIRLRVATSTFCGRCTCRRS